MEWKIENINFLFLYRIIHECAEKFRRYITYRLGGVTYHRIIVQIDITVRSPTSYFNFSKNYILSFYRIEQVPHVFSYLSNY